MDTTFNHLPTFIRASRVRALNYARPLINSADIRLTGPARLSDTVQEGALKALGTLHHPVTGYEPEEFIRGVYNALNGHSTLIILDPLPGEHQDRLTEIPGDWTRHVYRIGLQVENNDKNMSFALISDPDLAAFEHITSLRVAYA